MARHTIKIPINKSSNTKFKVAWTYYREELKNNQWIYHDIQSLAENNGVSDKLYCVTREGTYRPVINMGLAWDSSLIPPNKTIISSRLYLYTTSGHSRTIYYKFASFTEGSTIASYSPATGTKAGGMSTGWNYINLGELKGNSLIVGADLQHTRQTLSDGAIHTFEYWELNSHRNATNKPYLEIVYDDIPPEKPSSLYPNDTTQSTRDIIRFSWLHNTNEGLLQKGFTLQYSLNNGNTWIAVNRTTSNQYYDMPANTLPVDGAVMWRVRTIDGNDEISTYETASFNLGILPQQPPRPITPISQYVDRTKPIKFEWRFSGGNNGDNQSKFSLDYSVDGGSTWTTVTTSTPDTYYELKANTFSNGNVIWRVRTYSNWNEVSPYSENKSFTVIGSPAIPLIDNVSNTAKPIIIWKTTEQHAYELQIQQDNNILYDTGLIPSPSDRSLKVPLYLNDGRYIARLRIINEYNFNSSWSEKSFIISTAKPQKPDISVFNQTYAVIVNVSNVSEKTLIYRDGIPIGRVTNNSFTDYTGENGKYYRYFARTIDSNDNFSDSVTKLAKCKFSGSTIAPAKDPKNFLKLLYGLDSIPKKTHNINNQGGLTYYDGRAYPVAEYSEFRSKTKTISLVLKIKSERDKLIKMIESKETLLYRDGDGENVYGAIFNLDLEKNILGYYQVGFTISQTDYKGVAYD